LKRVLKFITRKAYNCLRFIYRALPTPRAARVKLNEREMEKYRKYVNHISNIGERSGEFVDYKKNNISFSDNDVKTIAFYLPQFHTIHENDEWWGKGFTEWTNVTKSMPLFPGHYQPHLPLETFYDLSDVDVMKRQVELAKNYGIYGFCFHYYWFSGKRLLEKPLENYLNTKEGLDFPFCINWANHSWTRVWDASEQDILIEQKHSEEDDLACIADICRYVKDNRYIRVNGKPLISIYNPDYMPDANKTISIWRDYCRQNGFGEIHIIGVDSAIRDPMIYNLDGGIAQSPHDINHFYSPELQDFHKDVPSINGQAACRIKDMERYVGEKMYLKDGRDNLYPGIITSFDQSPRRKTGYIHVLDVTPRLYREWLYDSLIKSKKCFEEGNRFVFINAWNEWAEGMHLEPDRRHGYAYLQATADAVLESKVTDKAVCYFDHNLGGGANQYLDMLIEAERDPYFCIIRYDTIHKQYIVEVIINSMSYVMQVSSMEEVESLPVFSNSKKIVINSLYSYPQVQDLLRKIIAIKKERDVELTINVHDYFSICPVYYLLDENDKYCGLSGFRNCNKCTKRSSGEAGFYGYDSDIGVWRAAWGEFLHECSKIQAFSNDSKRIIEEIYGELSQITITPHEVDYVKAVSKESKTTRTLNIGFLGHLVKYKGLDILQETIELVERDFNDIRLTHIGYTDIPIESKCFIQTGKYNINELTKLTMEHDIDVFLIPSICPETFSYTTQEVIEMGMPIACFNLGAQAERIKEYSKGVIIPEITAKCALETIVENFSNATLLK